MTKRQKSSIRFLYDMLHCVMSNHKNKNLVIVIWKTLNSHFKPPHPPIISGLRGAFTFYASESEWSPKVSGAFPCPFFSTHGTPFVKQLIIAKRNTLVKNPVGSHEINRLIFERPANKPLGGCEDSDFMWIPRLPENQSEVYMRWKSPQSPR